MTILIYSAQKCRVEKEIKHVISDDFPQIYVDKVDSISQLSDKLCQPLHGIKILILITSNQKELVELQELNSVFEDIKLIMVLPKEAKEMMKLGLKLYPSFICYSDSNINNIKLVLEKLQGILHKKKWRKK